MKANIFLIISSIGLAALFGILAYHVAGDDPNDVACGIGSTICFATTLIPLMGLKYTITKLGISIRVLSLLFFLAMLVSNFCFAGFGVNLPYYIIVNGILLLIFLAIVYKMQGITEV